MDITVGWIHIIIHEQEGENKQGGRGGEGNGRKKEGEERGRKERATTDCVASHAYIGRYVWL